METIDDQYKTNFTCKLCGKFEDGRWMHAKNMREHEECFSCNHFMGLVRRPDYDNNKDMRRVIVNGVHYVAYSPRVNTGTKGFGGSKFKVKFNNGEIFESDNVWCQGDIPEHLKSILPDNAEFLYRE